MQLFLKFKYYPPCSEIDVLIGDAEDDIIHAYESTTIDANEDDANGHAFNDEGIYNVIFDRLSIDTQLSIRSVLQVWSEGYPEAPGLLDPTRSHVRILLAMIKNLAKSKNITQDQMAELTGFQRSNIARMLGGKYDPTLSNYLKLAAAVGLQVRFESADDQELMTTALNQAIDEITNVHNNQS